MQFNSNEKKVYIVNCPKCGAALKVKDGANVYVCGGCRHLFQIRKFEKIIQEDVVEVKEKASVSSEKAVEIPTQPDIPEMDVTPKAAEETTEKEELPIVEVNVSSRPAWVPQIDAEEEEEGWEDDNRLAAIPVWQEEE